MDDKIEDDTPGRQHLDAVRRWVEKMECATKSEAIRQMMRFATVAKGLPGREGVVSSLSSRALAVTAPRSHAGTKTRL